MKLKFDISATEFVMVRDILVEIIPPGCRVWVFGSRAKNQTRCNSDLDLALEHKDKLPPIILHKLKEAFNDSLLPYRVDVLDINDVSENFQTIIRQQAIAFLLAKSNKVPKLRFKDEQGNAFPEWEEKRLGEVATFSKGKGISKAEISENGKNRCIRYGELFTIYNEGITTVISRTDTEKSDSVLSEKNDILMPTSDVTPTGLAIASALDEAGVVLGGDILIIRTNRIFNLFFCYFVAAHRNMIMRLVSGVTVYHIYGSDLATLQVKIPHFDEQQKIAAFLSAIDTKIAQVTQKKSLLEDYKKGCMQQLFSQKLRFRDEQGNAFPEWEEKRLGDLGKFSGGGTPDTMNADYWNGQIPWVSSSDICDGDLSGPIITRWISEAAINGSATKIVPANSVLIVSRVGVGKLTVSRQEICTSQDFSNFTPRTDNVLFLGYWLLNSSSNLLRLCQGTSIKGLTSDGLKALTLLTPAIPEQQKIADFLCAIDRKIDLITTELEHCKAFKKGLMQQMFV